MTDREASHPFHMFKPNKEITMAIIDKIKVSGTTYDIKGCDITTAITSTSSDSEVPSAKAVYDKLGPIETRLSAI